MASTISAPVKTGGAGAGIDNKPQLSPVRKHITNPIYVFRLISFSCWYVKHNPKAAVQIYSTASLR